MGHSFSQGKKVYEAFAKVLTKGKQFYNIQIYDTIECLFNQTKLIKA